MSLPVRCFGCNKVIGQYETRFENLCNSIHDEKEREQKIVEFYKNHNITRQCCKRMFTTVNTLDSILQYSNLENSFEKLSLKKIPINK